MSEQTVFRVIHTSEYFSMARSSAQDRELSWEARGMLAYLLSKPDDWLVRVADLQQQCGRDKAKAILAELEKAHYIRVERGAHNPETGEFATNTYYVYETPFTENPSTVKPLTVNPPLTYNRDKQSTDKDSVAKSATGSAAKETVLPRTDKPKAAKAPDPWYDNILAVWNLHAGGNTDMRKFLEGRAVKKGWKEYNPPPGYTLANAEEICNLARWVRLNKLGGKQELTMLTSPGKLQSAIIEWVDAGRPTGEPMRYQNERLFT
jgi:hypothetical protein